MLPLARKILTSMNKKQEEEWQEAQKILIGEDLVAVAQRQLEFLAAVDRQRWLYNSPGVERAIYRYKACWLPLLAKHSENGDIKGPLVVPLDCEWIWHCHRLNPLQYKMDCERVYGRILDCKNVESLIRAGSKKQSEEIWARLYPDEPFELDYSKIAFEKAVDLNAAVIGDITYDLVAAVQRQSSFYYQVDEMVSRPTTQDPRFLSEALKRYKGFLYLIKRNQEKSIQSFSVPTYDIDIIWHSHQLCPVSYCNDMMSLLGRVLQHDDKDSDRSIGSTMYDGFIKTTEQFEETFGLSYWRAAAMYRGKEPTPLTTVPGAFNSVANCDDASKSCPGILSLHPAWVVQIFLEIVDVKDAPINESETLCVSFTKNQPDRHFSGNGTLSIQSLTGTKSVAGFECEPAGEIALTLIAKSNSISQRVLGTTSIQLYDLTGSESKLLIDKWFEIESDSCLAPIYLHVAVSSTVPGQSRNVFQMVRSQESLLSTLCGFFSPLCGKDRNANYWTNIVDDCGEVVVSIQMRHANKQKSMVPEFEVVGITAQSKQPFVLAFGRGNKWFFNEICNFTGKGDIKENEDCNYLCELKGDHAIKLYLGKKLEYEAKCCKRHSEDSSFVTAVQFSNNHPYGKAIALLDMESKILKVNTEWFVLPWITLSSIILDKLGKEINAHTSKKQTVTEDTGNNYNKTCRRWFQVLAGKSDNCSDFSVIDGLVCYVGCYDSLSCKSGSHVPIV